MEETPAAIIPILVVISAFMLLIVIRRVLFGLIRKVARQSWLSPESIVEVFKAPSLFWCLIGAAHIGITISEIPNRITNPMHLMIEVGLIISVTLVIANISSVIIRQSLFKIGSTISNSGLIYGILKATIYTIGGLITLSHLGISIVPLITALGVGGAAVALALKDTLENIFSGIQLLIDKAIRVGDLIRLENGQEGEIQDIGWRTSKLRTSTNETIIVPNVKMAQSILLRKVTGQT